MAAKRISHQRQEVATQPKDVVVPFRVIGPMLGTEASWEDERERTTVTFYTAEEFHKLDACERPKNAQRFLGGMIALMVAPI